MKPHAESLQSTSTVQASDLQARRNLPGKDSSMRFLQLLNDPADAKSGSKSKPSDVVDARSRDDSADRLNSALRFSQSVRPDPELYRRVEGLRSSARGADEDRFDKLNTNGTDRATTFAHVMHRTLPASAPIADAGVTMQTGDDLTALLQRFCSALYVSGQSSVNGSHLLVALDTAIPGAAAEFVREGAFLRVRLHANNDAAFRQMTARRELLNGALKNSTTLDVTVEVVRDQD